MNTFPNNATRAVFAHVMTDWAEDSAAAMLTGQLNSIGIPITLPPNTCTATGATSTGGFELRSVQGENEIKGTYVDNWFVPAIGFVGQSTATIRGD